MFGCFRNVKLLKNEEGEWTLEFDWTPGLCWEIVESEKGILSDRVIQAGASFVRDNVRVNSLRTLRRWPVSERSGKNE